MNIIFERPTLNRKTADENIAIVDRWIADTVDKLNVLKVPEGSGGGEDVPTKLSELQDDSGHRTVTDTEKATWNNKAERSKVYSIDDQAGTIDNDDYVPFSSTSGKKKTLWSNIKTALKAYFDGIYSTFSGSYNDLTNKPDIDIYVATYGVTTYAEVNTAYTAGKFIVVNRDLNGKTVYALANVSAEGTYYFRTFGSSTTTHYYCYLSQASGWAVGSAGLAPLSSPAFTGTPTAPTATSGTNTTQIATTAFVQGEVGSKYDVNDGVENDLQDDDEIPFYDDSTSAKKKTAWSNIKAKLKTFFDALYQAKLTFDEYPRKTSGNPVRSRGIYSSVEGTEILVDDTLGYVKKNMLGIPSGVVSTTIDGITFYVDRNSEGECTGITVSGTATSDVSFSLTGPTSIEMPAGDFIFSGCPEGGSLGTFSMRVIDSHGDYLSDTGAGCSFHVDEWDLDTNYGFEIFIKNGTNMDTGTMDSYVFYPMIRKAEIISDKFFPHTNSAGRDNTKVAKAGDSMTGALTFDKVTNAIRYTGTKATYPMIKFVDNTGDAYGNGIVIGGGGLTVIGGGESADTYAAGLSGGEESLYLTNDGNVNVVTNLQSGKSSGKTFTFGFDGTFNSPSTIKQNGTAVSLSGHTHNYAGSSSAGGDANNALKLNGYASDIAATAKTIVRRDSNGYVYAVYYNQSSDSETATSSSYVMFCNSDGWLRKTPMSTIKSLVDTNTNTWRGFQFLSRTSGSQTIAAGAVATFTFSGLNNVSGYRPIFAWYSGNSSSKKITPCLCGTPCSDGNCSFVVFNQTGAQKTGVTVTIYVLYTQ